MPKGAFTPEFSAAAKPGDVVRLDPREEHYGVRYHNVIPSIRLDPIEVTGGPETRNQPMRTLEMPDNMLGQFRLLDIGDDIPDGVEVRLDHGGRESPMWTVRNDRGFLTGKTGTVVGQDSDGNGVVGGVNTHLSEIYVYEDDAPWISITNTTGADVTIEPLFGAFAFVLTEQTVQPDDQPVCVPVERTRP